MDLKNNLGQRPVARQMRQSLLNYLASDTFDPRVTIEIEAIQSLRRPLTRMEQLGATVTVDSAMVGYPGQYAIDGNPATIWHTSWEKTATGHPHSLILDLGKPMKFEGLTYLPRQDMDNGRIAEFEVFAGSDAQHWGDSVAHGKWPNTRELQRLLLDRPIDCRFVKLVAISEVKGRPWASAAEVEVIVP